MTEEQEDLIESLFDEARERLERIKNLTGYNHLSITLDIVNEADNLVSASRRVFHNELEIRKEK